MSVKLRELHVSGYKGIEYFNMFLDDDNPAVISGRGKTSVLEVIALMRVWPLQDERLLSVSPGFEGEALFEIDGDTIMARIGCDSGSLVSKNLLEPHGEELTDPTGGFLGLGPDPVLSPPVLYFHDRRRVPAVPAPVYFGLPMNNVLKSSILRAMVRQSDSCKMDGKEQEREREYLDEVNLIMRTVRVKSKLDCWIRRFEFSELVPEGMGDCLAGEPLLEEGDVSVPLHELGAGDRAELLLLCSVVLFGGGNVVLIDEPELHLHGPRLERMLRLLHELRPDNQYVFASDREGLADMVRSAWGGVNSKEIK